ncbi:FAD:protein FMN transferase [Blastococcus sp. CT_GayMR16]|uniref:FAD:protein FMN transferase n=1 Tax=Blastococcus sp. CT_GayMR16 TaxID=2559607 RepID=UPI001ADDC9AA|nr:FAD:protein FMN transferase [Blastococcus sp. CT_GayMR16]
MIAAADWTAWTCRVRVAVTDPAALDDARELVTDLLADVDLAASRFREDSELAAVDTAHGEWTTISPLFTELIAVALRAARLTDGDVDPTVGAALSGLGYDRDVSEISADGIVVATPAPGWRTIELDEDAGRVRVAPGVRLDLGATAKAWTADTAAGAVTAATGSGCLVSIGGDIAVAGPAPEGGWRIRVEDVTGNPDAEPAGPAAVVTLHDGGLATSSVRARRWQRDGLWLNHLIDPRTGLPPVPAWRTVSAAAGTCVDANVLSTAAVVRGHRIWSLLRAAHLPVRLVTPDGQVLTAGGWPVEQAA